MDTTSDLPQVALIVQNKANQRFVGAAVYQRDQNVSLETAANEKSCMKLQLYEFLDNDQFSNLDCFLNQIGSAVIYLPEDVNDKAKGDLRKVFNIVNSKVRVLQCLLVVNRRNIGMLIFIFFSP